MSDTIGLQPTMLLVPPSLETAARDILGAEEQVNAYLMDSTQWYLAGNHQVEWNDAAHNGLRAAARRAQEAMAAQAFKTLWVNDVRTTCHSPTKKEAPSFNNLLKERIK